MIFLVIKGSACLPEIIPCKCEDLPVIPIHYQTVADIKNIVECTSFVETDIQFSSELFVSEGKLHLENLGIVPGGLVTLINVNDGSVILKVKESRIALNKDMAMKIMV